MNRPRRRRRDEVQPAGEAVPPAAPGGPAAIEIRALRHVYPGGAVGLDGIDLEVAPGERVAVLGPNGAGKTTLALHLNGVLSPTQGAVHVGGLEVRKPALREVRRRVGIVFQDPDDQLFMPTVRDDVAFGPRNLGWEPAEVERRVVGALDAVGMAHVADRAPHQLSVGERRRVAVATVLSMDPGVLVLDEPSSNLDPASRRELADVVGSLEVTVVLVTHDLPYALELTERAVLLDEGRIVAAGPTPALLADSELLAAHRLELPRGFSVG